jgi:hypothetical protein
MSDLLERLANTQHTIWAHWMRYQFSKSQRLPDGSLVIPAELVARWEKQMNTLYADLSEAEKQSDRHQAAKLLPLIKGSEC